MTNPNGAQGAVNLEAVRADVPWVVTGAEKVLGDRRPTGLTKLLDKDDRVWRRLFRAWLRENHGGEHVAGFDFVARAGSRRQHGYREWFAALDALVPDFAEDVGELKAALRSAGARGTGLRDTATRVAGDVAAAAVGRQVVDTVRTTAHHLADRAATGLRAGQRESSAELGDESTVESPVDPAVGVLAAAVVGIADAEGPALVAALDHCVALYEYAGLPVLDDDHAHLTAYTGRVRQDLDALAGCRDMLAHQGAGVEHVAWVRAAVYRLAWGVDLSYQEAAGRLPHEGVARLITSLGESHCPSVRRLVAQPLTHLLPGVAEWLRAADACLTSARTAIGAIPSGYDADEYRPWGAHELSAAPSAVAALLPVVTEWMTDHDESDTEEERENAARACVGEGYAVLASRLS